MIRLRTFAFLIIVLSYYTISAQTIVRTSSGGYIAQDDVSENPTPEDYEKLNELIAESRAEYDFDYTGFKENVEFGLPIKSSSSSFIDNSNYFYGITRYFDHATSANYKDFNCGGLTHNGHTGTDFVAFPFFWYQYDNELFDAVAVADGVILTKVDWIEEDDNSTPFGNYIIIDHGNGYYTQYSHLKLGTLNAFNRNDLVEEGNAIGKVGISGNSNGPHMHFSPYHTPFVNQELTSDYVFDPYESSSCEVSSTEPRMIRKGEEEYEFTNILSVTTHLGEPVWKESRDDNTIEDPKFEDTFEVEDQVFFVVAMRDMTPGQTIVTTLYNPSGTPVYVWDEDANVEAITGQNSHSSLLWKLDNYLIPEDAPYGEWELISVITRTQDGQPIDGLTLSQNFNVVEKVGTHEFEKAGFVVYPNPCSDEVSVIFDNSLIFMGSNWSVEILDITGQRYDNIEYRRKSNGFSVDVSRFSKGVYFLIIKDQSSNKKFYQKLIK